ncbi:NPC intracellular cholesterol transporter 2 [Holothuria leucospilota]|uniref:NPC intracellular cholesterol transporter 2 n=1 Tax=Holothuria leucospilota TaxID=206669 RepID=A0A9Q1CIV6_HOLLE|nr:NPC intracellular cholesterol transporter 2 [Holothuria leucospilota]
MAVLIILLVSLLGIINQANSLHVPFKDCSKGPKTVTIKYVDISPCKKSPCTVTKGKNYTISIDFMTGTEGAKNLTASIFADIKGQEFPYPNPQPDACKDSGIVCPVKAKAEYTYDATFLVPKFVPHMAVVVGFRLKNEKDVEFLCVEVPCVVS